MASIDRVSPEVCRGIGVYASCSAYVKLSQVPISEFFARHLLRPAPKGRLRRRTYTFRFGISASAELGAFRPSC